MNPGDLYHFIKFSDGALREMPLDACLAHLEAAEPHVRARMQLVTMRVVAVGEEPVADTMRPPRSELTQHPSPFGEDVTFRSALPTLDEVRR
jgi:hypothetical protein